MHERFRAAFLSAFLLLLVGGMWELSSRATSSLPAQSASELVATSDQLARLPRPSEIIAFAGEQLSDPFYDRGTNDKGIGVQLAYSLGRVLSGFSLALLVAVPVGFVIGMSKVALDRLLGLCGRFVTYDP